MIELKIICLFLHFFSCFNLKFHRIDAQKFIYLFNFKPFRNWLFLLYSIIDDQLSIVQIKCLVCRWLISYLSVSVQKKLCIFLVIFLFTIIVFVCVFGLLFDLSMKLTKFEKKKQKLSIQSANEIAFRYYV